MSSTTFRHSGDLGDVIYCLPVMKALGGGDLLLAPNGVDVRESMSAAKTESLRSLLQHQSYVKSVTLSDAVADVNLDDFRKRLPFRRPQESLSESACRMFGVHPRILKEPWLEMRAAESGVILARSARYHGTFNWRSYTGRFVGTRTEHSAFEQEFGFIEFLETPDLGALGSVIAGSTCFVGNQSCPLAIAIGLGVKAVVEWCPWADNCRFERSNLEYHGT